MAARMGMIRSVGIISRPRREDIATVVPPLLAWLAERGVKVVCDRETAECIPVQLPACRPAKRFPRWPTC